MLKFASIFIWFALHSEPFEIIVYVTSRKLAHKPRCEHLTLFIELACSLSRSLSPTVVRFICMRFYDTELEN